MAWEDENESANYLRALEGELEIGVGGATVRGGARDPASDYAWGRGKKRGKRGM